MLKTKRNIKACAVLLLTMLLTMALFVSCEDSIVTKKQDPNADGTEVPRNAVSVALVVDEVKTLTSDIDRDIKYWEFMATPKFELPKTEKLYGQVSYWRVLKEMDTDSGVAGVKTACNLGRYTSGEWYFEVRALNSKKHVIYVGSTTTVLREGLENIVKITMLTDRADGTHGESADATSTITGVTGPNQEKGSQTIEQHGSLHIGFDINVLDGVSLDNLSIDVYKQKFNKSGTLDAAELVPGVNWARRKEGESFTKWFTDANVHNYKTMTGDSNRTIEHGRVYYETILSNIDAGPYLYTIYFKAKTASGSWINIAGQSVNVMIMGGEETQIKGSLLANEYVLTKLVLNQPGKIYGNLNGKAFMTVVKDQIAPLEWKQSEEEKAKSEEEAVSYLWFINGDLITGENGKNLNLPCPKAVSSDGTEGDPLYGIHRVTCVAIGDQGSLGSSTIDVIFNPDEGPGNVTDYPWPDDDKPNQ